MGVWTWVESADVRIRKSKIEAADEAVLNALCDGSVDEIPGNVDNREENWSLSGYLKKYYNADVVIDSEGLRFTHLEIDNWRDNIEDMLRLIGPYATEGSYIELHNEEEEVIRVDYDGASAEISWD